MSLFGRREDAPRERSEEERERARLEREARRATRRGDPPPSGPEPPQAAPQAPVEEPRAARQPPVEEPRPGRQPPVEEPRSGRQPPAEEPPVAQQPPVETPAAEEVDAPPRSARVRRIPRSPVPPAPLEDQPAAAPPPAAFPEPAADEPSPPAPRAVPKPRAAPAAPEPPRAPEVASESPRMPETTAFEPLVPAPRRMPETVVPEPEPAHKPPPAPRRAPETTLSEPPPVRAPRRAPPPAAYEPPPASEVPAHDPPGELASEVGDWAQEPSLAEPSFGEIPADPRARDHDDDRWWHDEEVASVHEDAGGEHEEPGSADEEPELVPEERGWVDEEPELVPEERGSVDEEPELVPEERGSVDEEPELVPEESGSVDEEPELVPEESGSVDEEPESPEGEPVAPDTPSPNRLPDAPSLPGQRASRRLPRARRVGGVGPTPGHLRRDHAPGRGETSDGGGGDEPPESRQPSWAPRRRSGASRPLALALLLVPVLLVGWLLVSLFQPFAGEGGERVSVQIPEGAGAAQIGNILADEGVVDSGFVFRLRATLSGERGGLRSGDYDLRQGMSYGAAIAALTTPPQAAPAPPVVDVTIPEGLSRREIAPVIKQAGIPGDYVEASVAQKGFRPQKDFEAPPGTDSLEGFLFPATYEVPREGNAEDLVSLQLEAFEDNFAQVDMADAKRRNLTPYDVLIIASMVEREAQQPEERPLIAAVIQNRLRDGMPLGIDATIRYANDNWDSPLRQSELQADGPYNTRTRTGLPPTPIGNPGLDSIKAAANPADEDFLFYVVKPGTCGEHAFSSTDAQFQQDVARYNQARDRAGGRSPTKC